MIVEFIPCQGSVHFRFSREEHDKIAYGRARASRGEFEIWLPEEVDSATIHPDLLALVALLVVAPWTTRRIVLGGSLKPSERFASAVHKAFGLRVVGWDADTMPREAPTDGKPCLAYSAGVDSTAALALMPDDTELVFLNRVAPGRGPLNSNYRNDFAMHAIRTLQGRGRKVHVLDSDLEYTRRPVGFPVDWSNAAPAVLLADRLGLRSMAWGMVLESAYGIGGHGFIEWSERAVCRRWSRVFSAVSLPMSPVVAGLSEVCTTKLVMDSEYADIAQSCIRGTVGMPCRECPKCFRKGLLEAALGGGWEDIDLARYFRSEEIRAIISDYPIKHENVFGYLLSRYSGSDPMLVSMQRRMRVGEIDYDLFERFYAPYLDAVPGVERRLTALALSGSGLDPMTEAEVQRLRAWRVPEVSSSASLEAEQQNFLRLLSGFA